VVTHRLLPVTPRTGTGLQLQLAKPLARSLSPQAIRAPLLTNGAVHSGTIISATSTSGHSPRIGKPHYPSVAETSGGTGFTPID
jgi:hypothetical protein